MRTMPLVSEWECACVLSDLMCFQVQMLRFRLLTCSLAPLLTLAAFTVTYAQMASRNAPANGVETPGHKNEAMPKAAGSIAQKQPRAESIDFSALERSAKAERSDHFVLAVVAVTALFLLCRARSLA